MLSNFLDRHLVSRFPRRAHFQGGAASALVMSCLLAAPAGAMSLEEAFRAALKNDPTYKMAIHGASASRESKYIGRAGLLPNINGTFSTNENRTDVTTGRTTSQRDYMGKAATISLRQPLFSLDAIARYRQGVIQAEAGEAQQEAARQQLIVRVVGAYIEAIFIDDQLALGQAQRDMLAEQQKVNERLYRAGEGTVTDQLETQAKLDLAEARLLELKDAQRAAFTTLSGIVGERVIAVDPLVKDFRIRPTDSMSYEDWVAIAIARNPELQVQTFNVALAREEVNKARAGHVPRLDFTASYYKNTSETIATFDQKTDGGTVGFQLNIPIYLGGAVTASTRQARANELRAKAELEAHSDKIMVDLRKEYDALSSSVARLAALQKAVESAQLLMKATEQSIKGGVRINLDLLNAQEQLFMSQRDLAQARYTYLIGILRLRAAAGTLSDVDVSEVASYFRQ